MTEPKLNEMQTLSMQSQALILTLLYALMQAKDLFRNHSDLKSQTQGHINILLDYINEHNDNELNNKWD